MNIIGGYEGWSSCTVCLPSIGCLALSSSRRLFSFLSTSLREGSSNFLNINTGDDKGIELLNQSSMPQARYITKECRLSVMVASIKHAIYWPLGGLKNEDLPPRWPTRCHGKADPDPPCWIFWLGHPGVCSSTAAESQDNRLTSDRLRTA